ncbi:MAG: Rpp14/Pop5 family protein [Promethearchaeota archaeon]
MVKQERQRYIFFKLLTDNPESLEYKGFINEVWKSIWRYFGMKEANKIGLWLTELNIIKKYGIIRCTHETKEILITALSLIREVNGRSLIVSPVKTSGTIKTIKDKFLNN